jgi:conjugal transfer pilus assembly protein TraW
MVRVQSVIWGLSAFLSTIVAAKDLGTLGHTFPIREIDLLKAMTAKLQALQDEGQLLAHQQALQQKAIDAIQHPQPVLNTLQPKRFRRFEYNPSIEVQDDLRDAQGVVFAKAGSTFNPLHYFKFQKLLFIDGDNQPAVQWALKQGAKIVLVKGSPLALSSQHERPFYFDQSGLLIKKLGITQVPAWVFQTNEHLTIEEGLEVEST